MCYSESHYTPSKTKTAKMASALCGESLYSKITLDSVGINHEISDNPKSET
jgi:hypothetical protein